MGKLILFLIILAIIYFIFKKKELPKNSNQEPETKDLIMCDKCKTFYTKNEIMQIDGKNICKECYDNS